MLCLLLCLGSCGLIADILKDKRLASQGYVDSHIAGNATKVTCDGNYDGQDATDSEVVVASMKYLKENYVKDVDFGKKVDARMEDAVTTNETYKLLVKNIVKDGLATEEAVEGLGERIGEVEKDYVAIGDVVDEDGNPLTSKDGMKIPTTASLKEKVNLSSILKMADGDKDNTSDTHFYSAKASNARFVVVGDFEDKVVSAVGDALADDEKLKNSIEEAIGKVVKDMNNTVSNDQLEDAINGLEEKVDGKFKDGENEKYALREHAHTAYMATDKVKGEKSTEAGDVYSCEYVEQNFSPVGHDHAKTYVSIDEVDKAADDGNTLASGVRVPSSKKLTATLDGYVKKASVVDYNKDTTPKDTDVYSASSMKTAIEGIVVNSQSQDEAKAYSASYVEGKFAKMPADGKDFLTTNNIAPDEGETTSSTTKVPTSLKAKKLAKSWFDENYVVV